MFHLEILWVVYWHKDIPIRINNMYLKWRLDYAYSNEYIYGGDPPLLRSLPLCLVPLYAASVSSDFSAGVSVKFCAIPLNASVCV